MRLNEPEHVREEYASEAGLLGRRAAYRWAEGRDALELLFQTIAALEPASVVEVGCGPGELSERIRVELSASVVALDISPLVAVTNYLDHLGELRALADQGEAGFESAFSGDNGRSLLAGHFAYVEEHDAGGSIRFPDRQSVVSYLESSISLKGAVARLPAFEPPFVVRRHPTIFVAQKA